MLNNVCDISIKIDVSCNYNITTNRKFDVSYFILINDYHQYMGRKVLLGFLVKLISDNINLAH